MSTLRPLADSEFLDVQGVAELLGVGEKSVYRLAYDVRLPDQRQPYQQLPGIKIGRSWRFHRDAIAAVVAGTYEPPTAGPVTVLRKRGAA